MKRWLSLLGFVIFIPLPLRADDSLARRLFEEGVAAAAAERWDEAQKLLEASLQESDKPTTRYNLVVTSMELKRPLEVARHALGFLAFPPAPALADASETVRKLLDKARASLAVLVMDALPPDMQPAIDGAPPQVVDQGCAYLEPGLHRLELRDPGGHVEKIEIDLAAGQTQPWPRSISESLTLAAAAAAGVAAPPPQRPTVGAEQAAHAGPARPTSLRRTLAWTLGVSGAAFSLTAVGLYAAAHLEAGQLSGRDVAGAGYPAAADHYGMLKQTILPFGLSGGALMAGGVAIGPGLAHRGSLGWAIGCLVAGAAMSIAGGVLLARTPDTLVHDTRITDLTREGGGLLLSGALPLLSYGATFLIGVRDQKQRASLGAR
jgi:hypothetical protein